LLGVKDPGWCESSITLFILYNLINSGERGQYCSRRLPRK
jgi:hypothetical protein